MRFMVTVKSDARSESGMLPDEKLLSEMGAFNQELIKAGVMLGGEGLKDSAKGVRVRQSGKGQVKPKGTSIKVIDGPFAEAKELVGGFWLISVKSKAEALDWMKRAPFQGGEVELRQLYELSDFPVDASEKPEGWREQEQALREGEAAAD